MNQSLCIRNLFDLNHTAAASLLEKCTYPWEVLPEIGEFIRQIGPALPENEYEQRWSGVWIHRSARLYPNCYIGGPCIIGANTEVRPGAFIRANALVGKDCVVGNSTELKNVILFDHVQVPHYNYVGDSILGYHAHMGAGAVTSNVKQDRTLVTVKTPEGRLETGLKKFGAILGDHVEVGCNSVLNPGTIVGRGSRVYPLSMVRGLVPEGHVYKKAGEIVEIHY